MLVIFFYGTGVGGAFPVVGSETSSARLRAKSNALGFAMQYFASWAFNFFVPYMFNSDQANWGGKIGFFFFGLCIVAFAVVWLEVPEMKGRTYAEIDLMFEQRLPTRAFKKHVIGHLPSDDIKKGVQVEHVL
jgi:hypothetical protein